MFSTQLSDLESPVIKIYTLESTITGKFDTILQRFESTGSMESFYDILYIARTLELSVSIEEMQRFLESVFDEIANEE